MSDEEADAVLLLRLWHEPDHPWPMRLRFLDASGPGEPVPLGVVRTRDAALTTLRNWLDDHNAAAERERRARSSDDDM